MDKDAFADLFNGMRLRAWIVLDALLRKYRMKSRGGKRFPYPCIVPFGTGPMQIPCQISLTCVHGDVPGFE
jgi:hypothetical protein